LVYAGLSITEAAFEGSTSEVIFFRTKPVLKTVLDTVDSIAERLYGPHPNYGKNGKTQHNPRNSDPPVFLH
jgi:hypothetical protein